MPREPEGSSSSEVFKGFTCEELVYTIDGVSPDAGGNFRLEARGGVTILVGAPSSSLAPGLTIDVDENRIFEGCNG